MNFYGIENKCTTIRVNSKSRTSAFKDYYIFYEFACAYLYKANLAGIENNS